MKGALQAAGGLALAALLLLWVLHGKDPKAISAALAGASLPLLVLGGAINLGHNVFRTWRWGLLLDPVSPGHPFRPMFSAILIGLCLLSDPDGFFWKPRLWIDYFTGSHHPHWG